MRHEVTQMMYNRFGYSPEKYEAKIQKYRERFADKENVDEIVSRMEVKLTAFNEWFIENERNAVAELMREIQDNFSKGNSIFPSDNPAREQEYIERRLCMDKAIGACNALKQELQYIISELPVDINKYKNVSDVIDKQISLIKGVRRSDNKFLKRKE